MCPFHGTLIKGEDPLSDTYFTFIFYIVVVNIPYLIYFYLHQIKGKLSGQKGRWNACFTVS